MEWQSQNDESEALELSGVEERSSSSLAPYRQAPHVMRGFPAAKPFMKGAALEVGLPLSLCNLSSFMQLENNVSLVLVPYLFK